VDGLNDLTIKEVAQDLDVSYVTVLKMVHRKEIKGVRRGGRWSIPKSEYNRFKKEGNHPDSEKVKKEEGDNNDQT